MLQQIITDLKNKFKEPEKTNYVGFCFGFTYGAGLTYKKVIGDKGFQVAFRAPLLLWYQLLILCSNVHSFGSVANKS
jgi:hypothetical protein